MPTSKTLKKLRNILHDSLFLNSFSSNWFTLPLSLDALTLHPSYQNLTHLKDPTLLYFDYICISTCAKLLLLDIYPSFQTIHPPRILPYYLSRYPLLFSDLVRLLSQLEARFVTQINRQLLSLVLTNL